MPADTTRLFDVGQALAHIEELASQRPVAARIIAESGTETADAKALAQLLAADVTLAGRVMKLANSAYFGMRGRVSSLQFAVTVVGFTTVRTVATVALTDLGDESRLPADFWAVSTSLAVATSRLAPNFGERPGDALCLGALTQLGSALLYHHDEAHYADLLATEVSFAGRRRRETERYGMSSVQLTAVALEQWGFPQSMVVPLQRVDDRTSTAGGLLRAGYEVISRLLIADHRPARIGPLSGNRIREDHLPEILYAVRNEAEDLRQLMIG
ncbi:MAG: HDOD domain-containing protein [Nocardioidaceae bacterium]